MDLDELWRKSTNAPTPAAAPAPVVSHQAIRAVVAGIGPVLREQLDGLRAENTTLRAALATLSAELQVKMAAFEQNFAMQQRELLKLQEELVEPTSRYTGAAVPRRLS